jgi:hypothetical protein
MGPNRNKLRAILWALHMVPPGFRCKMFYISLGIHHQRERGGGGGGGGGGVESRMKHNFEAQAPCLQACVRNTLATH